MTEFSPFETISGDPASGLLLVADHATNRLPPHYDRLGLPDKAFDRHIAYDIGIEPLTRALSARLGVPAVMSCFSRLLIDPNRGEDDPTLIMKISDGAIVPGNHPITAEEWQGRIERYHRPYHQAIDAALGAVEQASGKAPLVISLHSFTPFWKGVARPWQAAVLTDSDRRAGDRLIAALQADPAGLTVGDNEPYDGALKGDTMYRHCLVRGLPHVLLEVRQDLIADAAGVAEWADRLAPIFAAMNAEDSLHEARIFPSRTGPYE